jgi:hypothetical protein
MLYYYSKPVTEISMSDWSEVAKQHDIFYIMSGVSTDNQANVLKQFYMLLLIVLTILL